jgi:hypothetical protein
MTINDKTIGGDDCSEQLKTYFTTDMMTEIAPTDYHQNNASLLKLGRLVRSYEHAIGRTATRRELEFVFDQWCAVAHEFWRPGLTHDDYYAEFLEVYSYVHTGLNIELAVGRAKAAPLPEVEGFTDERIRLLVAICREMQEITGANPFFLPTRLLGKILGVHYSSVARWLRVLRVLQIIYPADSPGGNRCPRYYYGKPVQETGVGAVTLPLTHFESTVPTDGNQCDNRTDDSHASLEPSSMERAYVVEWLARISP